MILMVLACSSEPPPLVAPPLEVTDPPPVEQPEPAPVATMSLVRPDTAAAPLRRALVHSDELLSLRLSVASDTDSYVLERSPATDHDVLLVGLVPDAWYTVAATLLDGPTERFAPPPVTFRSDPIPPGLLPVFDVLINDRARAEPGWLLFSAREANGSGSVSILLDEDLAPRWWTTDRVIRDDLRLGPLGTLWAYGSNAVVECGWDLVDVDRYVSEAHHEVYPLDDGSFWTMIHRATVFDVYPADYDELLPVPPAVVVEDNPLVHIAADGTTLVDWPLAARLDRGRISWDGLSANTNGSYDWVHANAVIPDGEGGLVVSLRNQDAVVRLDAEGELDWILGDPLGWAFPFESHLLTPAKGLRWPYHQHGPEWHPEERLLVLFDNQDHGYLPYGTEPVGELHSRVVGYEVDGPGRSVRQLWEYDQTATGPLTSLVLGDADLLPLTGNVLATYGMVEDEGGVVNADLGFGEDSVRIVEFDDAMPEMPAVDLRIRSEVEDRPEGWQVYRARKIARPFDP